MAVAPPKEEKQEFRMVQFGSGSPSSMFNMSAFKDEGGVIPGSENMHGKWSSAQRLQQRFITMRLYGQGQENMMLCGIYNTYGVSDDKLGNMKVSATVSGSSGQTLQWAACDDVGECKGKSGNSLKAKHTMVSYLTDGWCVKPVEWNGNVVRVQFSDMEGVRGINFQSTAGVNKEYLFKDGKDNGMTGTVDKNGLVRGGMAPDIQMNLKGIDVPF